MAEWVMTTTLPRTPFSFGQVRSTNYPDAPESIGMPRSDLDSPPQSGLQTMFDLGGMASPLDPAALKDLTSGKPEYPIGSTLAMLPMLGLGMKVAGETAKLPEMFSSMMTAARLESRNWPKVGKVGEYLDRLATLVGKQVASPHVAKEGVRGALRSLAKYTVKPEEVERTSEVLRAMLPEINYLGTNIELPESIISSRVGDPNGLFYGSKVSPSSREGSQFLTKEFPTKGDDILTLQHDFLENTGDGVNAPLSELSRIRGLDDDLYKLVEGKEHVEQPFGTDLLAAIQAKRDGFNLIHLVDPSDKTNVVTVDLRHTTEKQLYDNLVKDLRPSGQYPLEEFNLEFAGVKSRPQQPTLTKDDFLTYLGAARPQVESKVLRERNKIVDASKGSFTPETSYHYTSPAGKYVNLPSGEGYSETLLQHAPVDASTKLYRALVKADQMDAANNISYFKTQLPKAYDDPHWQLNGVVGNKIVGWERGATYPDANGNPVHMVMESQSGPLQDARSVVEELKAQANPDNYKIGLAPYIDEERGVGGDAWTVSAANKDFDSRVKYWHNSKEDAEQAVRRQIDKAVEGLQRNPKGMATTNIQHQNDVESLGGTRLPPDTPYASGSAFHQRTVKERISRAIESGETNPDGSVTVGWPTAISHPEKKQDGTPHFSVYGATKDEQDAYLQNPGAFPQSFRGQDEETTRTNLSKLLPKKESGILSDAIAEVLKPFGVKPKVEVRALANEVGGGRGARELKDVPAKELDFDLLGREAKSAVTKAHERNRVEFTSAADLIAAAKLEASSSVKEELTNWGAQRARGYEGTPKQAFTVTIPKATVDMIKKSGFSMFAVPAITGAAIYGSEKKGVQTDAVR